MFEVAGTLALQALQQYTRPLPTAVMAGCYLAAFYFPLHRPAHGAGRPRLRGLERARHGPGARLGGLCQRLDLSALAGIALIVTGVAVLNLFSKSVPH